MTLKLPCSFKRAKQPGKLTRLLSCTEEQLLTYRGKDLVTTHVVPSLTLDPNQEHSDHYSAYNKPGAVMFWLQVGQGLSDFTSGISLQTGKSSVAALLPQRTSKHCRSEEVMLLQYGSHSPMLLIEKHRELGCIPTWSVLLHMASFCTGC